MFFFAFQAKTISLNFHGGGGGHSKYLAVHKRVYLSTRAGGVQVKKNYYEDVGLLCITGTIKQIPPGSLQKKVCKQLSLFSLTTVVCQKVCLPKQMIQHYNLFEVEQILLIIQISSLNSYISYLNYYTLLANLGAMTNTKKCSYHAV